MERWPPVYDARGLAKQIQALAEKDLLETWFFDREPDLPLCQGDIFELGSDLPAIDQDGNPAAYDEGFRYWMIIGNTCDAARSLEQVKWTQMIPLVVLGTLQEIDPVELTKLRRFLPYRSFYVPPWSTDVRDLALQADFTRPVTVHKEAMFRHAALRARLSRVAWVLFHSCLIRFFARDDGRYDP